VVVHKIVIKEIDIEFFRLFVGNTLDDAHEELRYIASDAHPIGKWCNERGIKMTELVLTKNSEQLHKVVLYATMDDIQMTEYALRF
jgi:hypothetical protein